LAERFVINFLPESEPPFGRRRFPLFVYQVAILLLLMSGVKRRQQLIWLD